MTKDNLINTEIASHTTGGKNKAEDTRGILTKMVEYIRQNKFKTIIHTDCTHILNRTYKYQITDPELTTLTVDGTAAAGGGVLLNQIFPHTDMIDGQELMLSFTNGGGLTFITQAGQTTNIIFISNPKIASPNWGNGHFIAQKSTNTVGDLNASGIAIGYESNLKVLLKWSESLSKWVELHRSGGNIY